MFGLSRLLALAGRITWRLPSGRGRGEWALRRHPLRRATLSLDDLEVRIVPTLLGQQLFPADYPWNQNISNAPVMANSAAIISHIGSSIKIHPDWGQDSASNGSSPLYGIPYNVVHGNTTSKVSVVIDNYPGESDVVPVPIPANAVIEGDYQNGPNPNGGGYKSGQRGDSHLIVWDEDNNVAYELYGVTRPSDPTLFPNTSGVESPHTDGKWHAAQESVWHMSAESFRSLGYTSADAAGLSILAGLVRPDEGLPAAQGGQGAINHALRFTLPSGDVNPQYIYPASHVVSTSSGSTKLPFGARLRLMNTPAVNAAISNMGPEAQVIAHAMQQYGLVLADIGSAMYVTGSSAAQDANNNISLVWNMNDVLGLNALTAGNFEVVNLTPVVTGLSASSGSAGTTITVIGQNFSGAAGHLTVTFGGVAASSVTYVDDSHLTVVVPNGSGTVHVQVQSGVNETDPNNPNDNVNNPIFGYGISATSAADQFTYGGQLIDNGQAGFSEAGTGWTHYTGAGYNNNLDYAAAGTGANTATWQFTGLAPGTYDAQVTWTAVANHATNATYTVYDGNTSLGSVTVNQQQAPSGTTVNGSVFQSLGQFQISSGTLKVVLTDSANGYVIADAARAVAVAAAPQVQVSAGSRAVPYSGSYAMSALVGQSASQTFTVTNTGGATLTLSDPITLPSGFTLSSDFGSTSLAPGQSTSFTLQLNTSSAASYSGTASFGTNVSGANPFRFTLSGTVATSAIVDNGQAGFSESGSGWTHYTGAGYNNMLDYAPAGSGSNTASWQLTGLAAGTYDVQMTWTAVANHASNATYSVYDGSTLLKAVTVNQQQAPSGITVNGSAFQSLGQFSITSGTLKVVLTDSANGYVIADALRVATAVASGTIIDNGQAGFSETGSGWTQYTGAGYNNNLDYAAAGSGANTASWQFTGLAAGTYDVQMTWNVVSNHATNATYSVYDGSTLLGTVTVNQQQAPSGTTVNGSPFQSLGQFSITSGTLKVVLTDSANGYVIADAARLVEV